MRGYRPTGMQAVLIREELPRLVSYRPYEVVTDVGSQGKLVSDRSRPGSAKSAFQAAQAASTTAS
jgi:hypothetical protein